MRCKFNFGIKWIEVREAEIQIKCGYFTALSMIGFTASMQPTSPRSINKDELSNVGPYIKYTWQSGGWNRLLHRRPDLIYQWFETWTIFRTIKNQTLIITYAICNDNNLVRLPSRFVNRPQYSVSSFRTCSLQTNIKCCSTHVNVACSFSEANQTLTPLILLKPFMFWW